jgi:hypothetical protein
MYAFVRKSEHVVWKEGWYALTLRVSLQANFYMTQEDQVFVFNVMVIDLMWETVASSVINRPIGAIANLNAIVKICKYRGFQEAHHFILMTMEVHCAPMHDMEMCSSFPR